MQPAIPRDGGKGRDVSKKLSAGLLMYRWKNGELEYFLAHLGGPFFARKDEGHWTLPKGLAEEGEADLLVTAKREFEEETGVQPEGEMIPLGETKRKDGKIIHIWAFEWKGEDTPEIQSNTFELEWPPKSGRKQHFPELDRADFFPENRAREKANPTYHVFFDRLKERLGKE